MDTINVVAFGALACGFGLSFLKLILSKGDPDFCLFKLNRKVSTVDKKSSSIMVPSDVTEHKNPFDSKSKFKIASKTTL
jgi:hypothetical protein